MHPWLSPSSTARFAERLSDRLKTHFPNDVDTIETNTHRFLQDLQRFDATSTARLAPVKQHGFFVFHDAYTGIVEHFTLNQVGYFTLDPSRKPGAKHLASLRNQLTASDAQCVFIEPQYSPALIDAITRDVTINRGELDPLATNIVPSRGSYTRFMTSLVDEFVACLGGLK